MISEDYHKNITDIDLEFNAQLSTSIYINCSYNFPFYSIVQLIGFFKFTELTERALRTDLSEFQGQNFKVGGTLGAEFVCFRIQDQGRNIEVRGAILGPQGLDFITMLAPGAVPAK